MSDTRARVLAFYGQQLLVECAGTVRTVGARRIKPTPVCNDDVILSGDGDQHPFVVTEVLPRRSELKRVTARGQAEVVCANIDQIVAVVAAKPQPDWTLIDRYCAAAEFESLRCVIVHNKADLPLSPADAAALADYQRLGIEVLTTSTPQPQSIEALQRRLEGQVSVLVGQSGVGKSTLTNRLIPDADQRTQALSIGSAEGKHTTTLSMRYHLPSGGELIDSPGVRDYAPPLPSQAQLQFGFTDIAGLLGDCQFNDCRHLKEPRCAVKRAVETGALSARRYHSYVELLRLGERFGA